MNLKELIEVIKQDFSTPSLYQNSRLIEDLVGHIFKLSWSKLLLAENLDLTESRKNRLWEALGRLERGEPLAYIIEQKVFYKDTFFVDSRVLIPRPETELVIEEALKVSPAPSLVVDLGTGSGCIGLSLAKCWPQAKLFLVDASEQALEVCELNRKHLGIENAQLINASVGAKPQEALAFLTELDLIVANPPYIAEGDPRVGTSVQKFEPAVALYSEDEGLREVSAWLEWASVRLRPGGRYIFEAGVDQKERILDLPQSQGFTDQTVINDYAGVPRIYCFTK